MIELDDQHTIVDAKAIFEGGAIPLKGKPQGNSGLVRCHFFETQKIGDFEIKLRLDWGDLSTNGDPKLKADITKGGVRFKRNAGQWHHTRKELKDGVFTYSWTPEIEGLPQIQMTFKVQTTHQHSLTGKARIVLE